VVPKWSQIGPCAGGPNAPHAIRNGGPALAARGVPAGIYVDNGSAFVDAWLLRACAKLGVRLVHSQPGRITRGSGQIERWFRSVREQFLIEVTDTSSEDLAAAGVDHATALLELNWLFVAWVEPNTTAAPISRPGRLRWPAGRLAEGGRAAPRRYRPPAI
jgi:putative transposase